MTIAQQLKVKDFPFIIEDSKGNQIYYEDLYKYWCKYEFDANGIEIYYENSEGKINDKRPKTTLTLDEIAEKFGISLDKLQIKK